MRLDEDPSMSGANGSSRGGKELHDATRPFVQEGVARSWLHVGSTFGLITGLLVVAAITPWWPLRVVASLLGALVMVRGFILYHDHMHGALLPRSHLARAIFRTYWDSAISLLVHGGLVAAIWITLGFWAVFFAILLPVAIAAAMGGYLFFAQHNYRGMRLLPPEQWNHFDAALVSSSFMKLGPVMNWFTGNIGYHHVHHLNPRIPFYRLPEVMAALPELQHPATTSLRPRDIADCFRMALWNTEQGKMVTFREARGAA